ncbi:MAG TPA: hypothetical protein VED59_05280 [Acidimicrobiales bacterium]|nr:hypothetical protein [Acidimicrobiales bacterium]
MFRRFALVVAASFGLLVMPVPIGVRLAGAQTVAQLSVVRAAAHPGYDRLVFQFTGTLPATHSVTWVKRVVQDPSGKPIALLGRAFVRIVFNPASAHTTSGQPSYSGVVPAFVGLQVLCSVKMAGDFEAVLSFGVGLIQKTPLHVFTLTRPTRFVIDFAVP